MSSQREGEPISPAGAPAEVETVSGHDQAERSALQSRLHVSIWKRNGSIRKPESSG